MQKFIPLLLPPLLSSCAAFTAHNVPQDVPALVFVDGQISDSADTIAHTQQRLTPPRAVTPTTRLASAQPVTINTAPLPVPELMKATPASTNQVSPGSTTALTMTGTPQSVAVLSISPARNLTLEQWVRRIIPTGWSLEYENALRAKLNTRVVSVYTNDLWTRVLERLLAEQSIAGHIDWNKRSVTLSRAGQAQPLATASTQVADSTAVTTPPNPFSGGKTAAKPAIVASTAPLPGSPTAVKLNVPANSATLGKPVAPVIDGKTWQAPAGKTLREVLSKWVSEQRCESGASANWTLIWPTAVTDYQLEAPLTFRGSFESMLDQMFRLYKNAETPLYADGSRVQCLVAVSDTPAKK